jgi:hypothetical protein
MKAPCLAAVAGILIAAAALAAPPPRRAGTQGVQVLRDATTDNNASCDISTSPAATLLLPYFEVDINSHVSKAANTIFSIINTSRAPQIARVTVWTDSGYPALWFNIFLTGYDVQSISLYDVLSRGVVPATSNKIATGLRSSTNSDNPRLVSLEGCSASGGELAPEILATLQTVLTTGTAESAGACRVGSQHANAEGYVTVDLVNSCSSLSPLDMSYYSQVLAYDNVLTGDYERINPDQTTGNFAGGNPLVHIKAIPEGGAATAATPLPFTFYDRYTPPGARKIDRRQPLPSSFAARFIQGGKAQFYTDFVMWREGAAPGAASCTTANAVMTMDSAVRFDEDENPTVNAAPNTAPASAAVPTTSAMFPPLTGYTVTGWMLVNLDNKAGLRMNGNPYSTTRASQNWLIVRLSADGRYAVDYDATSLKNGCVNTGPVISSIKQRGDQ